MGDHCDLSAESVSWPGNSCCLCRCICNSTWGSCSCLSSSRRTSSIGGRRCGAQRSLSGTVSYQSILHNTSFDLQFMAVTLHVLANFTPH